MKFELNNLMGMLPESLRREKKKAAALGLLLMALGVLAVIQLMPRKLATVSAATPSAYAAPHKKTKLPTEDPRAQLLHDWLDAPTKPLTRNIFSVDYDRYPPMDGAESVRASGIETIWDRLAKSESKRADEVEQRRIRAGQLLEAARRFKLQTTLINPGATSRAMVNGRLVRTGDKLELEEMTFTVLSIDGRQVIVEREGVKIALSLGRDAEVVP